MFNFYNKYHPFIKFPRQSQFFRALEILHKSQDVTFDSYTYYLQFFQKYRQDEKSFLISGHYFLNNHFRFKDVK
jgi:hypothetical protein